MTFQLMMYRRTDENRVQVAVWVDTHGHVYQIEMSIQTSEIMMDIYWIFIYIYVESIRNYKMKLELQLASSCTQDDAHAVANVRQHRWR